MQAVTVAWAAARRFFPYMANARARGPSRPRPPRPAADPPKPKASPASADLEEDIEFDDLSPAAEDAYAEIARIREQIGDEEAKVILRRAGHNGTLLHVGVLSATDFDIERVIRDFGGGRYEASFYQGKAKIGAATFEIDPSIPQRLPPAAVPKEESAARPEPTSTFGDPRLAALEQVLSRQADLLNQLVINLATNGNGKNSGKEEALDIGLRIAELIAQKTPSAEKPSFAEIASMIQAGIELGRKGGGDGEAASGAESEGDPNSYWPVINTFAKPIARVMEAALVREGKLPPGGQSLQEGSNGHTGVAALPNHVAAAPPEVPMPQTAPSWMQHLRPSLPQLLNWARAGKDPELYAAVIIDNLPPGVVMEMEEAAKDPTFVDRALAALPMFQPYSAWATRVLQAMKTQLTEVPEEEGADAPESG